MKVDITACPCQYAPQPATLSLVNLHTYRFSDLRVKKTPREPESTTASNL